MNRILTEQNTETQLQRLAAQREMYSKVKKIFRWQFILVGPVAAASAILAGMFPCAKGYVALWGIMIAIADFAVLTPWQKRTREIASLIQEMFDCDVLCLPWSEIKAGKQPGPETIYRYAKKYQSRTAQMPPLENWYSIDQGSLPLHVARLICQRANCWWDAKQHRSYANYIMAGLTVVALLAVGVSLFAQFSVADAVLKVAAPLLPLFLFGLRHVAEHRDAAARLDRLRGGVERLWNDTLGKKSEREITLRSRALQDEILENRRQRPCVPDIVYKYFRDEHEELMNAGADKLITEAKQKLGLE